MDNVLSILNFLPTELIYIIISYTYKPQSKLLTNDIKNFYKTRAIANKLYIMDDL